MMLLNQNAVKMVGEETLAADVKPLANRAVGCQLTFDSTKKTRPNMRVHFWTS